MHEDSGDGAVGRPTEEPTELATTERLPDGTVRHLVARVEQLEADLRGIRVRVSAPDRCESLLEELVRLQHAVERLALAVVDAHLEARLSVASGAPRDALALKTFLDGIGAAIRRAES